MSILIKGMEMPKSCMECRLCNKSTFDFSAYCSAKVRDIQNWEIKQDWCPLIEIPPHGPLIDMDDFLQEWSELESYRTAMELCEVIEAEGRDET